MKQAGEADEAKVAEALINLKSTPGSSWGLQRLFPILLMRVCTASTTERNGRLRMVTGFMDAIS